MANIVDYVNWRGDLSFSKDSFNLIDNLILAEICYIDLTAGVPKYPSNEMVTLHDAIEEVFKAVPKEKMSLGMIVPNTIVTLADLAKDTKRFGSLLMSDYVDIIDKKSKCQFSAVTYHFKDVIYVSYRGTDDTLIGWQENLDQCAKFPVPAQKKAADYLNKIAAKYPETTILLGGHSKGANLANYAIIYCDDAIKERIKYAFCNDGQGFSKNRIDMDKFNAVKSKIIRIIPEHDVVGMIFDEYCGKTVVVKSDVKGIYQHDGFSWQLIGTEFIKADKVAENSLKLSDAITDLLERLTDKERASLAEDVYHIIVKSDHDTLTQASASGIKMFRFLSQISTKNRHLLMEFISYFFKYRVV